MLKRYIYTSFIAIIISLSLSKNFLNTTLYVYDEVLFTIEHDYSKISELLKNRKNIPISTETPEPNNKPQYSPITISPNIQPSIRPTSSPVTPKPTPQTKKKNYTTMIASLKKYLADQDGTYGLYFVDLTDGQKLGINENKSFIAASTVKVPINLYLYTRYSQKKVDLDTNVEYLESDYEEGTGNIQFESFGNTYNLRELSKLSIEVSDNVAINMLSRYLVYENVVKYMEGLVKHPIPRDENVTNPKDMAIYLKTLLDLTQKSPQTHELLDFLLNTEFNDRMPLYLPSEVPVAHKIGTQVGAIHDVGIVFANRPYILCLYSQDIDEETAPEILGQLSKMVYDYTQN